MKKLMVFFLVSAGLYSMSYFLPSIEAGWQTTETWYGYECFLLSLQMLPFVGFGGMGNQDVFGWLLSFYTFATHIMTLLTIILFFTRFKNKTWSMIFAFFGTASMGYWMFLAFENIQDVLIGFYAWCFSSLAMYALFVIRAFSKNREEKLRKNPAILDDPAMSL